MGIYIPILQSNLFHDSFLQKNSVKIEETESTGDTVCRVHHRGLYSAENIATVCDSVDKDLELSILRRLHNLSICGGAFRMNSCTYTLIEFINTRTETQGKWSLES